MQFLVPENANIVVDTFLYDLWNSLRSTYFTYFLFDIHFLTEGANLVILMKFCISGQTVVKYTLEKQLQFYFYEHPCCSLCI